MTVRVATWNVGSRSDGAVKRGINKARRKRVDVLALQECGDRKWVSEWAPDHGWRVWSPDRRGGPSVPILYRVPVTGRGSVEAVPPTPVGDPGAGPARTKAKVITWLDVAGLGRVFNTHLTPSVTRVNLDNHAERVEVYDQHIDKLADLLHAVAHAVALGDFNAPPGSRWLAPLRALAANVSVEPTRGGRVIDLAWVRGLRVLGVRRYRMPSDHRMVVVTLKRK